MSRRDLIFLAALAALGCSHFDARGSHEGPRVEFGVFYGGQVQGRSEIPFEVDPGKQRHGFRIHLPKGHSERVRIDWEVDMPGTKRMRDTNGGRGAGRLTSVGSLMADPRLEVVDKVFNFKPGDPLGIYNFRLVVDGELVADRSVTVYDPGAREASVR